MEDARKKEILSNRKAIKKLWLEGLEVRMPLTEIYKTKLGEFFNVANFTTNDSEWLFFLNMTRGLKNEMKQERIKHGMEHLNEEQVEEVQDQNRRQMILMLREIMNEYATNPKKLAKIDIGEIRRLYGVIQNLEESRKKTELQRSKLQLDAVKTFILPYQRMSIEQLNELKANLENALNHIIKIKSEGDDVRIGQVAAGGGRG